MATIYHTKIHAANGVSTEGILFISLGFCFVNSPTASLVLSALRLAQRDYSDLTGDTAKSGKLNAALNIFYSLVCGPKFLRIVLYGYYQLVKHDW